MPDPQGFTDIQSAPARWGRSLPWWYQQVKRGNLQGYQLPGVKGTWLRDSEVEAYVTTPQPRTRDGEAS